MKEFKPFFMHSCLCLDDKSIESYDSLMKATAYNTGNSYITYGLLKATYDKPLSELKHIQNMFFYDFSNMDKEIDIINNECTHVFYMLHDIIRIADFNINYSKIQEFISKFNKPIIVAGIGANSFEGFDKNLHTKLKPELVNFLKFLSDHCIQIGIRGNYTEEVLHNLGIKNVSVIGCPSYYETGRNRIVKKSENIELDNILLSHSINNNFIRHNPQVCQDFQEQSIIKAIAFNDFSSFYDEKTLRNILDEKYYVFSNLEDWKNAVKKYKFVIGDRLHGSIVSTNAGIPALCTNRDTRAQEMCNYLNIPHRIINQDTNIIELYNELDYSALNNNYNKLYDNYEAFLNKNNVQIINNFSHQSDIVSVKLNTYKDETIAKELEIKRAVGICNHVHVLNKNVNELKSKINETSNNDYSILSEQISLLNDKIDNLDSKMNMLFDKINTSKNNSTFKLFAIEDDLNHKVIVILGIKIKLNKHRVGGGVNSFPTGFEQLFLFVKTIIKVKTFIDCFFVCEKLIFLGGCNERV